MSEISSIWTNMYVRERPSSLPCRSWYSVPFSHVYQTRVNRTDEAADAGAVGMDGQGAGHLGHEHDEDEVVEQLEEADGPPLDHLAVRSRRTHPLAQRVPQPGGTTRRHRAIVLTIRTPITAAFPVRRHGLRHLRSSIPWSVGLVLRLGAQCGWPLRLIASTL